MEKLHINMALQRMGVIYCLLFAVIRNAASVCKISMSPDFLSITKGFNPLIYNYKSDGRPVIHYPSSDSNCIFQNEDERLHLACSHNDELIFYQKTEAGEVIGNTTSSVYLLHDPLNNSAVRIHGGPSSFALVPGNFMQCFFSPQVNMFLLNKTGPPSEERYVVGYKLNDIDLLKVYDQVLTDKEWIVTRYRINPVIRDRPETSIDAGWIGIGLFYLERIYNFSELYSKEHQIAKFQRSFGDVRLTEKYFSGNNSLVKGQLMFDEDTFYLNDLIGTRFYENVVPIWRSVYEGNWRTIGNAIRKIADETARELDVYVTAWPSYQANNLSQTWALGETSSSPGIIPVPHILVKAAIDVENRDRGIVFHIFNDPHLDRKVAAERMKEHCSKTVDCKYLHLEFDDVYKGFTFCCMPSESYVYKQKFE